MPDQRDIDDVQHSRVAAVLVLALVLDFFGRPRAHGPDPWAGTGVEYFSPGHAAAGQLLGVGETEDPLHDGHLGLLLSIEQATS